MSKHCSLQETAALLQAANKIVLCSHVSPDGDTLGSALSLMKALQTVSYTHLTLPTKLEV